MLQRNGKTSTRTPTARTAMGATLTMLLAAGCASGPAPEAEPAPLPPPSKYSLAEYRQLTACVGLSDTARHAAAEKLKGVSADAVKQRYATTPQSSLHWSTVDKVYREPVSSSWDYTVSYFGECASQLAAVSMPRSDLASYCMQNQMIADVAFTYKAAGAPRERAYKYFEALSSQTPNAVIDWVYASPKERAKIRADVWSGCMQPLVGGG